MDVFQTLQTYCGHIEDMYVGFDGRVDRKSSETDSIKSQISSKTARGTKGQHTKTPEKKETISTAISYTGGSRLA